MGLDQYAYKRLPEETSEENVELAYWRKHNRLHGWMEELWDHNGRPDEEVGEFNCIELEITLEDLDQLEADINDKSLPETGGFFFGNDSYEEYEEYYKETDLQFIEDARRAIQEGKKVYYNSWW